MNFEFVCAILCHHFGAGRWDLSEEVAYSFSYLEVI